MMNVMQFQKYAEEYCWNLDALKDGYIELQKYFTPETIMHCFDINPGYTVQDVIKGLKQEIQEIIEYINKLRKNVLNDSINFGFTYPWNYVPKDGFCVDDLEENMSGLKKDLAERQAEYEEVKNYYLSINPNGGSGPNKH